MTTRVDWQRWIAGLDAAHDRWQAMEGHVIPGDEHDPTPYVPITPEQARAAVAAIAGIAGDLQRAALSIATSARRTDPDSGWTDIADAATEFAAIAESAGQLERHQTTS